MKNLRIGLLALLCSFALSMGRGQPPTSEAEPTPSLSHIHEFHKLVSFEPDGTTCSAIYRFLSRESGVKINTKEREFTRLQVFIGYEKQPIHTVMDALAAMYLAQWQKDKEAYYLISGRHILDAVYGYRDEHKQARLQAGWEFIRSIENIKKNESFFSPAGLPYSSFSPSLQNDIRQMMSAMQKQNAAHPGIEAFVANLDQSNITIRRKVGITGTIEYFLGVRNENGDMGFRIHNYGDPKALNNSSNGGKTNIPNTQYYPTEEFEISEKDAKKHPALRKTVTINLRGYTFPLVMRHLHQEYSIPFVSDLPKHMPQKANVSIGPVSLGKALDYLTSVYKETEWELRKSGFIIVRGPTNPARDALQGRREGKVKSSP